MIIWKNWQSNYVKIGIKHTSDTESVIPVMIKRPSLYGELLQCFSVYTNTKIIFGTKLGPDTVAPIHGLRFLGMVWIIMIHTIFYMADFMGETYNSNWTSKIIDLLNCWVIKFLNDWIVEFLNCWLDKLNFLGPRMILDNKPWSWRMAEGFAVQVISNATLSVDTFFFLSGFLVAYLYLKPKLKSSKETERVNYKAKVFEFLGAVIKRFIR